MCRLPLRSVVALIALALVLPPGLLGRSTRAGRTLRGAPTSPTAPASTVTPAANAPSLEADAAPGDEGGEVEDGIEESLTCGVERWDVKTGTDADAGLVNTSQVTPAVITALTGLTAPASLPSSNRVQPTETTVYQLTCTLVEFKQETDNDYHLVLSDGAGHTMIAEIPNPGCVGSGSPFLSAITSARSQFDAVYTATSSFQTVNVPVQVTGVGFFDFLHGQTGVAPNGIELHPILNLVFNPSQASDFSLSANPVSLTVAQGGSGSATLSTAITGSFSSAVALSASGLPSGVTAAFSPASIASPGAGASTLTLTASSSAATASSPITVTATGGGRTHSLTISLTVTAGGGGGSAVVNGGFESGLTGWTAGGVVAPTSSTAPAHTGSHSAYLTGGSSSGDSTLYQALSVPTTGGTLSFWYYPASADTITYDWQEMDVCNASGTVLATPLKACSNAKAWTNVSVNMAAYAGTTVRILFKVHDDGYAGDPTSMYVDDVVLSASTPPPTYSVSGTVSGAATSGVAVTLTGAGTDTTTTGAAGTYSFTGLTNGTYTLTPGLNGYTFSPATAAVTVSGANVAGVNFTAAAATGPTTLFSNGFESSTGWSQTDTSGTAGTWSLVTSGTYPTCSPHAGTTMAKFNSYTSASGSATRYYRTSGFAVASTYTTVTLTFWIYHDTAYSTTADKVQPQVSTNGSTWTSVGAAINRYDGSTGWKQHSVTITTYRGSTVYLGFLATSAYGDNIYVDDVLVVAQ